MFFSQWAESIKTSSSKQTPEVSDMGESNTQHQRHKSSMKHETKHEADFKDSQQTWQEIQQVLQQ
jgi:hypothetical protein